MEEAVPANQREFDWYDSKHDPEGKYLIDCRVNNMPKPQYLFAVPNDDKTRDAMITLLQHERWGLAFRSLAIFEDQEQINRKVLARFTDVCEKQFSASVQTASALSDTLKNLWPPNRRRERKEKIGGHCLVS